MIGILPYEDHLYRGEGSKAESLEDFIHWREHLMGGVFTDEKGTEGEIIGLDLLLIK